MSGVGFVSLRGVGCLPPMMALGSHDVSRACVGEALGRCSGVAIPAAPAVLVES